MLTVKTELIRGSKSTNERDPSWSVHYFSSFVSIAQQAGQKVVLGHLSLSMCLWSRQF
jgi:hypothetical protein